MPIEATPENLMKVQTELNVTRAQQNDLILKIRHRELIDRARFEATVFARARRVRDQVLSAPARHAAILAAELDLAPGALAHALGQILHASLTDVSRHPPRIRK